MDDFIARLLAHDGLRVARRHIERGDDTTLARQIELSSIAAPTGGEGTRAARVAAMLRHIGLTPITDPAGNVNLQPGFTLSATANPVFDYLGRALPAATYTITSSTTGSTVTVSVSTSGRVSIP